MGDTSLYDQCPTALGCLNCTCADCAPVCSEYSYQHNFELDSFAWVVDLVRITLALPDNSCFESCAP